VINACDVLDGNPKVTDHPKPRRKSQYNMTINLTGRLVVIWAGCIWLWVLSSSRCCRNVNENLVSTGAENFLIIEATISSWRYIMLNDFRWFCFQFKV